jgi:hypothetical protein
MKIINDFQSYYIKFSIIRNYFNLKLNIILDKKKIMMDINKETISRLKFIGKIQIGDKVNLRYMYIQPDGLLTQISRSLLQDNRTKTLSFLQDTINKTFEILKCYEKTRKNADKIMCLNLINDLKNSKNGLNNLKETYALDIKFVCDLDTLLQTIDAKLTELDKNPFSPLLQYTNPPSLSSSPFNIPPPFPSYLKNSEDNEDDEDDEDNDIEK